MVVHKRKGSHHTTGERRMIRWVVSIGAMLLSGSALAEASYLCVSDEAVGFSFKATGGWGSANFGNRSKYLVSQSSEKGATLEVKEVGETEPTSLCKNGFSKAGVLICEEGFLKFRFNRNNGRFLSFADAGYWSDDLNAKKGSLLEEGKLTPYMERGKCSPL